MCKKINLVQKPAQSPTTLVNLKEIPTQNSKGNSMARRWKKREYDSTVCNDMRKSIKTTQEVRGGGKALQFRIYFGKFLDKGHHQLFL